MNASQRIRFRIHVQNYIEIDQILYRRKHDGVLLRCVPSAKTTKIIEEFYFETSKGHYFDYTIVGKIIQARYYWSIMFKEAFAKAQSYEKYQRFLGRNRNIALPLNPIQVEEHFQ